MGQENITKKLDINNDSKISTEELKNNISKFDQNDWYNLSNELERNNQTLIKLLEPSVSNVIKEKKLYDKQNKTVDELKILKLGFLCYKKNSATWTGSDIATYVLFNHGNWESYKKNILPLKGISNTGKTDQQWLIAEGIDKIQPIKEKPAPIVKPAPTRKPMPVANPTPADEVRESIYVQESEIPEIDVREGNTKYSMDQIIKWAESKYLGECENRRLAARDKYVKNKNVLGNINLESYISYEVYLFAFEKYCEVVNKKHDKVIEESGYKDNDEFESQMNLLNDFQKAVGDKYNNIGNDIKKFEEYSKDMQDNKDKYFQGKSEEDIQLAEEKYKEFKSFQQKKYKENGITDDIITSINKTPQSSEETKRYYENLNKILKYQAQLNQEKGKNGDMIDKYDGYVKGVININDKYNDLNFDILKEYNHDIAYWTGYGIDFNKYSTYTSLMQKEGLSKHFQNISKINNVLMDPTSEEFPISQIKNDAIEKQLKAERIEATREKIKTYAPRMYLLCTAITGFWNGLVDATIGVGTSLGAMLLGCRGRDEYEYQLKRKAKWDNFLKINQSSSQTQAVYDSETGAFNFHLDNTISTVSGSIAQMICLISGGGAVGKGVAKLGTKAGIVIGEEAIAKVGLFGMSFITQAGSSYQEAINGGLEGAGAFAYSMFSASIQSGLELISPNEVLLGKGTGLGKELVQNICGNGNKEGIKLIGKYFLKTVGREILEENLQEGLQLAAGNLINDVVNGIWNTGLESDWNPKNFLSTAIITTLTTGITTGSSAIIQGVHIFNSNQQQLIARVSSDPELYEDVMNVLDNSINGDFNIPNIDKTSLQDLRTTLNNINTNHNNSINQNEQQQSHQQLQTHEENNDRQEPMKNNNRTIELDPQKQNMIESIGSKFHEERRKSLRRSDGTYESRIEQVTDQEWIQQHNGQTEVDLANTNFEDLPNEWKYENLEAAKVVLELVYDKVMNGEEITTEMVEEISKIVHNKRLERNGTEGSFENQRVPYDQLSEEEKAKDRNQVLWAIETINQNKSPEYFGGKSHKFDVNENQARGNSEMMDNIIEEINEQNKAEKLEKLRKAIGEQYNRATGQNLTLTDEQLLSIIDAHEQDGILGELTTGQLKQKVKILSETITDKSVRRFLLEAGFCGKLFDRVKSSLTKKLDYSEYGKYMEQNVDRIIPQSYFSELDFVFRAGRTEFLIEQTGNGDYRVINLTDYQTYEGGSGSESIIGREGDIPIQSDDYASKQHLRLKIDSDGNVIIRDTSTNGTLYFFTDKQLGTQYVWEIEQQNNQNRGKYGNDQYIENGYQIGEEVNIPRSDGRVTKATITAYNPQTGEYRVEWIENGNQCHKDIQKWQLDSVNNSNKERYVVDYDEIDTSEEQNRERPDRGINTERKERSDVQRNSDVIAIGDLHGEYAAFKGNMEFAGLAREVNGHLEWIGGDKKVVFQGDILADRGTDGLRIIEEIHRLREQAREQGGDIDIIIGNHDDFMISFLTQRNGAHGNGIEAANHPLAPTQGLGLTELAKFIGGETGDFDIIRGQQDIILNEMRKSPEGRIILEEICNMKLISQVDDVLYCHTNPTETMMQYLTNGNVQNNINYVNYVFQGYLRSNLLLEGESPISKKEFNKISDLFLDTGNRDIGGVEKYSDILRNAGINVICHGHSGGDGRRYGNKNIYTNNKVDVGVEIIDTDNSYGKGGHTNGPHSVCIVKQDGGQTLVGEEAAY